ncbi:MAG TPA: hypothetical protein PKH99_14095, partial [Vicinamibacterales bacterium]|nr:hypothetical protein [Vicinamibacterales bacterium]
MAQRRGIWPQGRAGTALSGTIAGFAVAREARVARFRLIPREEKFYDDFLNMAEHICSAAR